jgi:glucosamine--fructose-6-phosphate aminotransferase (isomerizing)
MSLHDEIHEQPAVARRLITEQRPVIERIARALSGRPIDLVVIAARGSSDHAAIYGQYLFGAFERLPVALATPALTSVYGVVPRLERALVIGISQSGRSPDVVGVIAGARGQGGATIAITNAADSPLAEAAEHVIDVAAGPERAVAATKTYTAQLIAIALLATAIGEGSAGAIGGSTADRWAALAALPDAMAEALGTEDTVASIARERAALDRCIVLGRGFDYATAREWALKLKELAQVGADPYSAADFMHGPMALVEPDYPVLAIAASGAVLPGMRELLERLRDQYRVDLVTVSDDPAVRAIGSAGLAIPRVAEWLSPVVSILPAQLFAYHVTQGRGLDAEHPRWISKVTLTH